MKRISFLNISILALILASCAPGAQYTLPPDVTFLPGTDIPQQVASVVAGALTQTAFRATATPIPGVATLPAGNSSAQKTSCAPHIRPILIVELFNQGGFFVSNHAGNSTNNPANQTSPINQFAEIRK